MATRPIPLESLRDRSKALISNLNSLMSCLDNPLVDSHGWHSLVSERLEKIHDLICPLFDKPTEETTIPNLAKVIPINRGRFFRKF